MFVIIETTFDDYGNYYNRSIMIRNEMNQTNDLIRMIKHHDQDMIVIIICSHDFDHHTLDSD